LVGLAILLLVKDLVIAASCIEADAQPVSKRARDKSTTLILIPEQENLSVIFFYESSDEIKCGVAYLDCGAKLQVHGD
jgi:hypothetical protein